jgi:KaiC/GvpD/RAD55 family RecA-like ATPase
MASRDPEQVVSLWDMAQQCQPGVHSFSIGVATGRASRLLVIDVDSHKVPSDELGEHHALLRYLLCGLTHTLVHRTQNGGTHYIYELPRSAPLIKNLPVSPYIDVRCEGGYVVWPPSAGYRVQNDVAPELAHDDLIHAVTSLQEDYRRTSGSGRAAPDMSGPELTAEIEAGRNLHDNLFAYARLRAAEGMSQAETVRALRHMLERSKRRLEDPAAWQDRMDDLERTVADAYARSSRSWDDIVEMMEEVIDWDAPPVVGRSLNATSVERITADAEAAARPGVTDAASLLGQHLDPVAWIVPNLIPVGNLVSVTGPSGVGKTRWTAALVMALAAGRADLLGYEPSERAVRVAWYGNEERTSDLMRRAKGAARALGISSGEAVMMRGKDSAGGVVRVLGHDGSVREPVVEALIKQLRAFRADVAIFDPLISLGAEEENSAGQMSTIMGVLHRIGAETGATVLVVHHSPKERGAAPDQLRGDYGAWRGSGAIYSSLDVGLTLMPWVPPSVKSSAEIRRMQLAVMDGQLPRYVVCDMAKQREGQQVASALWEIVNHELGDGQGEVGVMIPADFDHAERKVKMVLDTDVSDRVRKFVGAEDNEEAKVLLADALVRMMGDKDELHHVSVAQLVRGEVLPEGARADTEGMRLKKQFERWVANSDGSAKVRIKIGHRGRMSVYRQLAHG